MKPGALYTRIRRVLKKPPGYVFRRAMAEVRHELDRFTQPRFGRRFGTRELLAATGARDLGALWDMLVEGPGWAFAGAPAAAEYDALCPGDTARIIDAAERAVAHRIDLLGSGPVELGPVIDWHRDYKTGDRWPLGYFRSIDYVNQGRPSDVKTAWELSRLQWLLPCGQAYALTGDERYASAARDVLEQWIAANPYAASVNWGVTMEPAMRLFTWFALLRLCGRSPAWSDAGFRGRLMCSCYTHAVFTERFIERADVNGNHFTADAAALVVAGAMFSRCADGRRWLDGGLADLEREIVRQVHPDGVDFEASTAYHRLVAELFLAASMAARAAGRQTSVAYRERLRAMARFTAAYMRPDDTAPLWGDHDDARTLPMGPQSIRDHRYLVGLIALHLDDRALAAQAGGPRAEAAWWFGAPAAATLPPVAQPLPSTAFPDGGVYVMRGAHDHVYIDCGPIGLAGRGGHGHNDLLSFEAVLGGRAVVAEGGCYVYTADFASRNLDRATVSHNTVQVDGEELNRFYGPDQLWTLVNDAGHADVVFQAQPGRARFAGSHTGYARLAGSVSVRREIEYDEAGGTLAIVDRIEGGGTHEVSVPLHLAPGCEVVQEGPGRLRLRAGGQDFRLEWDREGWAAAQSLARVGVSYGRAVTAPVVTFRAHAPLPLSLRVVLSWTPS